MIAPGEIDTAIRERLVDCLKRDDMDSQLAGVALDERYADIRRHVDDLRNRVAAVPTPLEVEQLERDAADAAEEAEELAKQAAICQQAAERGKREADRLASEVIRAKRQRDIFPNTTIGAFWQYSMIGMDVLKGDIESKGFTINSNHGFDDIATQEEDE